MLTRKQHELLMFIHERIKESGVSPSFDEMKEALDLASKSGIHRLITALEERGFLRRLPHRARALEVLKLPQQATMTAPPKGRAPFKPQIVDGGPASPPAANDTRELPILGKIAAGTPIEAIQQERDRIPVAESMLGAGEHFVLEIQGDSMINAGILRRFRGHPPRRHRHLRRHCRRPGDGRGSHPEAAAPQGRFYSAGSRQSGLRDPDLRPRPGGRAGQTGRLDPPVSLSAKNVQPLP